MIPNPNLSLESYGDLFGYTDEERKAVERYLGFNYKIINSLFVENSGEYEKRNGMHEDFKEGNQESIDLYIHQLQETIKMMPLIYSAMMKFEAKEQSDSVMRIFHRGTSLHEIRSLVPGESLDRLVSATGYSEGANWQSYLHNENKDAPVHMQIRLDANSGVPTIDAEDIFPGASGWEKETIIAPFAQIKDVHDSGKRRTQRGTVYDEYTVSLMAPELEQLQPDERTTLEASILERAPRIHGLIAQVLRRDVTVEDLEFKIDIASKRRREYKKERNLLNDELANLYFYSTETDLRDMINFWSFMIEKQDTGRDVYSLGERQYGVMRIAEMYGIPLDEYTPELQEFLIRELNAKLADIDMCCHENDKFSQTINEAFSIVKLQNGISREEMFYELQRRMKGLDFQEISPNEMLRVLEEASEYFSDHLRVCGYGDAYELEQKMERTKKKIDSLDEDLQYLDEDERKCKSAIRKLDEGISAILPEINQWKADVIRICKSDCREVELDFITRMNEVETAKKKEAELKNAAEKQEIPVIDMVSSQDNIAPAGDFVQSENIYEESSNNTVSQEEELRMITSAATRLKSKFDPRNVRIASGTQGDLELVVRRNEKIAAEIQSVSGTKYSSKIKDYKIAMERAYHSVERLVSVNQNGEHSAEVLRTLNQAEEMDPYAYEGEIEKEIMAIQKADENLLKKVVFEKFCKIAIGAEIASLSREARGIREEASKKGLARLFRGVSKQEMVRGQQIESYVESVYREQPKQFMGKEYSYRDIMAEMDFFIEERQNDSAYVTAVAEVQKLQGVLNTHYRASQRDIDAKREEKKADSRYSAMDSRIYRINSLKKQMERNGLITRSVPQEALGTIQQTERFITSTSQELGRRNSHDLNRYSTEISQ